MAWLASRAARRLLFATGVLVLVAFVWYAGPAAIVERLGAMGPLWPLFLVPSAVVQLLDTVAWRLTLPRSARVGFLALLEARLSGEAVNTLTPTAYVGGEPVKAIRLAPAVPVAEGLSSVIIGRTLMTAAQVLFVTIGVAVALGRFEGDSSLLAAVAAVVAATAVGVSWLVRRQREGFVGGLMRLAERAGLRPAWAATRAGAIADLDARVARSYREDRARLYQSAAVYLLAWIAGTAETWTILTLMGLSVDLQAAFAIEALSGLAKAVTFVIPASLGGQEGGNVLVFAGFGYPLAVSVGYSVLRRARELLWAGIGLALLSRRGRTRRGIARAE
ncbi:MAG TPA: lysylphosphatidylglycerol synthase domain-containing protein [Thermodesulfobacteriota bacterium]